VRLLGAVGSPRLRGLAEDADFLARLEEASADLQDYLTADRWYQTLDPATVPSAIGYFSMEYGITEVLPQYSGGLGILAGDHLKAASDLGVPIVGVGLLYKAGYFVQSLSADGWQQELYPGIDPHGLPVTRLLDHEGAPVTVDVALPEGRTLHAQVWREQVGRVPLLLLDSDVEANESDLRSVTDRLYGGTSEHRLRQELLLGIGGVRALRAWSAISGSPAPEVFHCNEGHAGFLGVERARELMVPAPEGAGLSWGEAARCSPPTPRSPPASTASPARWSSSTCRGRRPCRASTRPTCWPSAPRTTRTPSTWPTWACASRSAATA